MTAEPSVSVPDRRDVLKSIAVLMGCALSPSTLAAALAGEGGGAAAGKWKPRLLTVQQNELVATIADLIIPTTDTPGARAAGVHQFIDLMLAEWMKPEERDPFLEGLAAVDAHAKDGHGKVFVECSEEEQTEILKAFEAEAGKELEARRKAEEEREKAGKEDEDEDEKPQPFFRHVKELTLVGYYTSEIGASTELNYVIVFDEFQGCVPLGEVGAAWS